MRPWNGWASIQEAPRTVSEQAPLPSCMNFRWSSRVFPCPTPWKNVLSRVCKFHKKGLPRVVTQLSRSSVSTDVYNHQAEGRGNGNHELVPKTSHVWYVSLLLIYDWPVEVTQLCLNSQQAGKPKLTLDPKERQMWVSVDGVFWFVFWFFLEYSSFTMLC